MLIHLVLGCMNLWGNIAPYEVSYYHYLGNANATTASSIVVIPLAFIFQTPANIIGVQLFQRVNGRIIILVGAIMIIGATELAIRTTNWIVFIVAYGAIFPFGVGLCYYVPMVTAWEWFPERKGLITGLIVGCFGLSSFFFGFFTTAIVNPENALPAPVEPGSKELVFPQMQAMRAPTMLRYCQFIWAALLLLGIILVTRNPKFEAQNPVK